MKGLSERGVPSVPTLVLAGLTLTVAVALVVALSTSGGAFSVYNDNWDGTSSLRGIPNGTQTHVETDTAAYQSLPPTETVAFVLSPESSYRPRDVTRLNEFVRSGGTLVVADDFGPHANPLLQSLNASARIDGRPLYDVRSHYRSSAMPVATNVTNHSLVAGVDSLTLNYGTAVRPNGATVLVNTSDYAYLDADRNGVLGENESLGTYTVATAESVGAGRVVVVSDPSVFINAMLDRPGNRQFARALVSGHSHLLVDYSHAGAVPPLVFAVLAVRDSAALQFGLGAMVVGALAVWSRRPGLGSRLFGSGVFGSGLLGSGPFPESERPQATTEELAAHLERRHPDWDPERIERVVSALERRRNE